MNMFRAIAVLVALTLSYAPSYAQWQTPTHSVPTGRGAGATGFGSVTPGTDGQVLFGNTGKDPSFQPLATAFNAACTVLPSVCIALLGYANPIWFGAKCDASTDDTTAFFNATAAANRKVLSFPSGAVCVVQHFEICSNPTCQTGRAGGSVPILVQCNGATLAAPASTAGAATFVYVEQQTATNVANFAMRDCIINGNNFVNRGLTVVGCLYCSFVNIGESNAQVIGCHFSALVGFIIANSLFERIQCNNNNMNSGTQGVGLVEETAGGWLGSPSCTAFAQNAGNTFVSVHTLFNGLLGWSVDCANNTHINPDMEQNLSFGLSVAQVVSSEWIGAQFSSNRNNRGGAGTGGDASVLNNDASPGLQFFGGASDGTFTNVSGSNGDTLAMHGITGFGFTANCNTSGHFCMTLP